MKKILFTTALLLCFCLLKAQSEISTAELFEQVNLINPQINENWGKGDYQAAEEGANKLIALFYRMTDENQKELRWIQAELLFARTCLLSLQNKTAAAIEAFEKAIEYGFNNYPRAKNEAFLNNIRTDQRFIALLESISEHNPVNILRKAGKYQRSDITGLPRFTYESATSDNLKKVREFFNLDSIAGQGDEISKIKNLLKWVQANIRHDGSHNARIDFNSIDIYNYHKSTGNGVNCRLLAITLNEMYLAMGFKSRYVTCLPKTKGNSGDAHVINSVYSTTLNKWLWMDPTFNAYLKDEYGNLLSIEEVRERVIEGRPLILNDDAYWNDQTKQTKETYIDNFMTQFLYMFTCISDSKFNAESRENFQSLIFVSLIPSGTPLPPQRNNSVITHDAAYFWEH